MRDDSELLHDYAENGSQEAFAEVVRRHIDLVYSAAMRRTGDCYFATDVTQEVFIFLARQAPRLADHPALAAWLHTASRNAAINLMTSERRRKEYETRAATFSVIQASDEGNLEWNRIRPVLDAAIDTLPEPDRIAIVLRFLNRQSFAAIGLSLRVSEDAARMRTERALEKLRARLSRQGISSTAAALGVLVSGQAALSAPAGLAAAAAGAAMVSTTAGIAAGGSLSTVLMTTTQKSILATAFLASLCTIGYQFHQAELQRDALASARNEIANLRKQAWDAEQALTRSKQESEVARQKSLSLAEPVDKNPVKSVDGDSDAKWLEHLQFLAFLEKEKILPSVPTIVGFGQTNLAESFTKLFRLSTEETNALNQAFQDARDKLGDIAAENANFSMVSNSLIVTVNPFKDQGQLVHDQLIDKLVSTLGADRFEVFQTLVDTSANPLDRLFGFWGDGTQTIAISRNPPASGTGDFRIVEAIKSSKGSTSSAGALENPYALPARLKWLSAKAQLISDLQPTTSPIRLTTGGVSAQ